MKLTEREVLNPLGEVQDNKLDLNPLPYDFHKVSLVDNTKPGADIILKVLSEALGNREFLWVKKPAGAPATEEQIKKATSSDVAILALGDCGSCTSWVILDAIRLEKEKIPTISICSDHFAPFARNLAESHGLKDMRILEIKHPIAGLNSGEIKEKTLKIVQNLLYVLQIP
ncbi:UGSC family (seleno)protein [Methanobacterium petrolearium]|uniref:UGSC family (seleno)protein n=1 Tax=Methanobacterium petrolearium TaxID=710190 RepID=UPI0031587CF5